MIAIRDLRYRWPKAAADCLAVDRLELAAGETLFLHGPSGSGKSTLLGLLAGVLLPYRGEVAVKGTAWSKLSAVRRDGYRADHVGYVFQQFNLLTYLSVRDNVMLPCRFSAERRRRATEGGTTLASVADGLLEAVGLAADSWQRPAATLSVGQQQRVAAARALIGRPEVVIADEPTSALDAPLRDSFMTLLLERCRNADTTLVFVSHDERLAARFDRNLSLADINAVEPTETAEAAR